MGDEWNDEANQRAINALKAAKDFTIEGEGDAERAGAGPGGLFADLVIREPSQFKNRTFTEHLLALPWTAEDFTSRLEEVLSSSHMSFCRLQDDQLAVVSGANAIMKERNIIEGRKNFIRIEFLLQPADVHELKNTTVFLEDSEPLSSPCQHEFREDLDQQHLFSCSPCKLVMDNKLALISLLLIVANICV